MKNFNTILFLFLLTLPILVNFLGCANPLPPSGGPRDTIPPKVIEFYPKSGLTNYRENFIKIEFDKYMDKNSVQQNTTIIPKLNADFNWSGKKLEIKFLEEPEKNTTYSITIGTEIQDWKGNKPDEAFSIIFSTGDNIDSGRIKGKLISANPVGASIFLYKLPSDTLKIKSFDITKEKPNYNIQIGSSGYFEIKALKDGFYRLIAVRDIFKNGFYDDGEDEFGSYIEDIHIKQDSVVNIKLKLGPSIDKLGPMLYGVIPLSNNIIEANFSEPLDSNFLFPSSIGIIKIGENNSYQEIVPSSIIISPENRYNLMIFVSNTFDTSKTYRLECKLDKDIALRDSIGNIIRDTANSIVFNPVAKELNLIPKLVTPPLKDSVQNVSPDKEFYFVFNVPLKRQDYNNSFKLMNLTDKSDEKINILFKTDNIIIIKPEKKLSSDVWYELSFKSDSLLSIENIKFPDSSYTYHFKTADIRNYSGISGILKTNVECEGDFYIIIKNHLTKTYIQTKINNKLEWKFDDLPPGDYEFEVFCDEDGDAKYSYGYAKEFRYSERFFLPKDKITLKPRWKLENYQLEILNK